MTFSRIYPILLCLALSACSSIGREDEPPFVTCPSEPDPELILISSTSHFNNWLTAGENVDIAASVTVTAPVSVGITGYTLEADGNELGTWSEPAISLPASTFGHGAHTISLYANLKIEDFALRKPVFENQQLVVFNKRPDVRLSASVTGHISAVSTSGETYERDFTAESNSEGRIRIPSSYFAWTPAKGTASSLKVELTFKSAISKISEGLTAEISDLQWNVPDNTSIEGPSAVLTWSNPATEKDWYGLTPSCRVSYNGTYEGITLDAYHTDGFIILLTDTL